MYVTYVVQNLDFKGFFVYYSIFRFKIFIYIFYLYYIFENIIALYNILVNLNKMVIIIYWVYWIHVSLFFFSSSFPI